MTRKRNPGAHGAGAHEVTIGGTVNTEPIGIDRAAADDDERRLIALIDLAAEFGLSVSRRCEICRHHLTDKQSLLRGIGPKCAARLVVSE